MSIYKGCKEFFISQTCALAALLLLMTVIAAQAQTVLTADQWQNGQAVELDKLGWKYSPGDEWSEGHPQDDDITFVVLKIQ